MKRIMKKGGAILLAFSLLAGSFGIAPAKTPSSAAEVTLEQAGAEIAAIGAKITELAKAGTLRTAVSGSATIMGSAIPFVMDMDIDVKSMTGHGRMPIDFSTGNFNLNMESSDMIGLVTGTTAPHYTDMYMDLSKDLMVIHDEVSGIDIIRDFPSSQYLQGFGVGEQEGNMFTSMLSPAFLGMFAGHLTLNADAATLGGEACKKIDVNIKYAKGELVPLMEGLLANLPEQFQMFSSMIDPKMFADVAFDLTITLYETADHTPKQMGFALTLDGITAKGMSLGTIKVDATATFSASADPITIPAECVEKAIPAPGSVVKTAGLTLMSDIKSNKAFFFVTDVKKNAKKIVIPAKATVFGKTLDVSKALSKVFSSAKKLKTLVVKNAALKKALKKNRKKYGLSKKVKIK